VHVVRQEAYVKPANSTILINQYWMNNQNEKEGIQERRRV